MLLRHYFEMGNPRSLGDLQSCLQGHRHVVWKVVGSFQPKCICSIVWFKLCIQHLKEITPTHSRVFCSANFTLYVGLGVVSYAAVN